MTVVLFFRAFGGNLSYRVCVCVYGLELRGALPARAPLERDCCCFFVVRFYSPSLFAAAGQDRSLSCAQNPKIRFYNPKRLPASSLSRSFCPTGCQPIKVLLFWAVFIHCAALPSGHRGSFCFLPRTGPLLTAHPGIRPNPMANIYIIPPGLSILSSGAVVFRRACVLPLDVHAFCKTVLLKVAAAGC